MYGTKFLFCLLTLSALLSLRGAPDTSNWAKGPSREWHLTLESAQKAAEGRNKKIYVLFTGSDWCGFCVKLKKDVLTKSAFKRFAARNLELVYIDFPRKKNSQPGEQKKYNSELRNRLRGGGGVPSVLILDAKGNTLGRIGGYRPLKRYMDELKRVASSNAAPAPRSEPAAAAPAPAPAPAAVPEGWGTSLENALEKAKARNTLVLVLKTGSDWCPPCKRLGSEALSSSEFKEFAAQNLELVYLDFPRRKEISPEQRAYNTKTSKALNMGGGVPSLVVLDSDGIRVSATMGYRNLSRFMEFLKKAVTEYKKSAPAREAAPAVKAVPEKKAAPDPAETQASWKASDRMQDIQVSISKWGASYDEASLGRGSFPRTWETGKRFFLKIQYDLPANVRGRFILQGCPVLSSKASHELSKRGTTVLTGSFQQAVKCTDLQIAFIPRGEKKVYVLQHFRCDIDVKGN